MRKPNPALRLDRLSKSFGGNRAVDELSLTVQPGEMVGFLGPNGAGKSTTLYMVTGLVRPSAGRMEVFGCDVQTQFTQAMAHVGSMVETPTFHQSLSARKNLELLARIREAESEQIDSILRQVGLHQRQHDKVEAYSQGMKQRLGLATALIGTPKLLLLDEPTNGLDPEAMRETLTLIKTKVTSEGLAVFISSHLLAEVEEYCDRVVIMNKGRLVCSGSVQDILDTHDHIVRVAFSGKVPDPGELLGNVNIAHVAAVGADVLEITLADADAAWLSHFLWSSGYRISLLRPKDKTLKEFFLAHTEG